MTTEPATDSDSPPIILFDGECGLCHRSVRFVAKRDHDKFRFAALQSPLGERLAGDLASEANRYDSLVLVDDSGRFTMSTGALRIVRQLKWPWPLLFGFIIVPRPLRDLVYKCVAKYRLKWFGSAQACDLDGSIVAKRLMTESLESDS